MACSIVITVNLDDTQARAQQFYQVSGKPREQVMALRQLFKDIGEGRQRATASVQTGDAAPVAASGTWTLASVVATDVASCGGVDFTFTATPSAETDVEADVPAAKAFASATDISLVNGAITESTHGYETGVVGQLSTSGSLPTGFSASTDYYVIRIDADTYALASSYANAVAGTRIIPTAIGSGNQTYTPNGDAFAAKKLSDAVNAHSTLSDLVTATWAAAVVTVAAKQKGIVGNFIQFADSDATITSSGSGYLAGGTGGAMDAAVTNTVGL